MTRWEELAPDLREAMAAFAVLTQVGVAAEVIQIGWVQIVGQPQLAVLVAGFPILVPWPSSWAADRDNERRLLDAMAAWNALGGPARRAAADASQTRRNLPLLLARLMEVRPGLLWAPANQAPQAVAKTDPTSN